MGDNVSNETLIPHDTGFGHPRPVKGGLCFKLSLEDGPASDWLDGGVTAYHGDDR